MGYAFSASPIDRLNKVLKVLRFAEGMNISKQQQARRIFHLSNMISFPLSMPLLVLRTTFNDRAPSSGRGRRA